MVVPQCIGLTTQILLYSRAVTTKVLAVLVSLYYPLAAGSVEYPMPYASCLGCCGVLLSCVRLSSCVLLKGTLLVLAVLQLSLSKVLGFCSLFCLVHICNELWDSLSGHMHSGITCLAFQVPNWAVAFWGGLSCLWLVDLWLVPTQVCLLCVYCKFRYDWATIVTAWMDN